MASSYGKRTWFHQIVGIVSLLAMVGCFLMLDHKPCQIPLLPREELSRWSMKPITGTEISTRSLRQKNQTSLAIEIELFIENYYDRLQIFQVIIGCWSIVIIILGLINIVPKHEDFKVLVILFLVIIMGFAALFAFYTAFLAFHKPCRSLQLQNHHDNDNNHPFQVTRANLRSLFYQQQVYKNYLLQLQNAEHKTNHTKPTLNASLNGTLGNSIVDMNIIVNVNPLSSSVDNSTKWPSINNNNNTSQNSSSTWMLAPPKPPIMSREQITYMLEFRSIKDKRPVNVFEDEDETMIRITLINSAVGFILLCSDFLFFFDSRQHMIEWRN